MRSYEDRLAALNRRATEIKKEQRGKRVLAAQAVCVCLCLVLLGVLAAFMPRLTADPLPEPSNGMNASIFSKSSTLGFLVTGILSFLLGIAATLFCVYLNRWNREKAEADEKKSGEDKP